MEKCKYYLHLPRSVQRNCTCVRYTLAGRYYAGPGNWRRQTPVPEGPIAATDRCTWCWRSGGLPIPTRRGPWPVWSNERTDSTED
uniref:Uncharacterized protein n=1 Tax=Timema genevievae TaxID=629358 RepID=A0A7R9K9Y7_TIMGE|nr:unnamed protein product [Timema genevievae]